MRRQILIATFLASSLPLGTTKAQASSSRAPADASMRQAAINAVLAFRQDLNGDSVKIARCRLASSPGDSVEKWILPRLRPLLIAPFKIETPPLNCSVMVFQHQGTKVLWLEGFVEVHRSGGMQSGPIPGLAVEISFQWLRNTDYRRFEEYELRPLNDSGTEWRVVRYEFRGEEWMEPFGGAFVPGKR